MDWEDRAVIQNIRQGDSAALKQFFDGFYPSVCVFARKYLRDTDLAEDVAQETFIEFWKKRELFEDLKTAKGFIYTVCRNKCLNHIRISNIREDILQRELVSEDYFYELILEEESYRIVYQSIESLASQSRKIILLSLNGYKNPEIAEELDISVNTVKTLKKNAYKELRHKLRDQAFVLFLLNQMLQ